MVPILELRGAIPAGVIAGLDVHIAFIAALIGNLIPVPFVMLLVRKVFTWLKRHSRKLAVLVEKLEAKVETKKDLVLQAEFWGLVLLVAVPLPGTGAWTGAMVAAFLDLRYKRALPAIALGVLIAGIIVTVATYGVAALV